MGKLPSADAADSAGECEALGLRYLREHVVSHGGTITKFDQSAPVAVVSLADAPEDVHVYTHATTATEVVDTKGNVSRVAFCTCRDDPCLQLSSHVANVRDLECWGYCQQTRNERCKRQDGDVDKFLSCSADVWKKTCSVQKKGVHTCAAEFKDSTGHTVLTRSSIPSMPSFDKYDSKGECEALGLRYVRETKVGSCCTVNKFNHRAVVALVSYDEHPDDVVVYTDTLDDAPLDTAKFGPSRRVASCTCPDDPCLRYKAKAPGLTDVNCWGYCQQLRGTENPECKMNDNFQACVDNRYKEMCKFV